MTTERGTDLKMACGTWTQWPRSAVANFPYASLARHAKPWHAYKNPYTVASRLAAITQLGREKL
jgi:hypothetical protein